VPYARVMQNFRLEGWDSTYKTRKVATLKKRIALVKMLEYTVCEMVNVVDQWTFFCKFLTAINQNCVLVNLGHTTVKPELLLCSKCV
jgi:hypothetical protein